MHALYILYGASALLILRVLYVFIYATFFDPLRHIPGPLPARFTKLWYLYSVYTGRHQHTEISLHRSYAAHPTTHYAPIVRLAPQKYSLTVPEKQIYGVQSRMPKSSWYEGWKHPSPDRWTLFTDRNIKRHGENRRLYSGLYAMSGLVSYERYVDECKDIFSTRMSEAAHRGESINMGHWLQCYAFDVIGAITYGKRFGFLDEGRDLGDTMGALDRTMVYSALIGVYAWLHPYLYAILEYFPSTGAAGRSYLMRFATQALAQRRNERAMRERQGKPGKEEKGEDEPEDFIDKMMDMQGTKKGVTDYHVLALTMSNIVAGSDTTATSLSSIVYHLIRTPSALHALRNEISQFAKEGRCDSAGRVDFKTSQDMKYFQACIKEGLRLHPATGLPLWRVVGDEGATLCGEFFPPGSEVGINSWVAHYNKDVWGEDVEVFRPERWIEASAEEAKTMEANYLPFGLGARTCIGRHISHLEMSKLLPQLVTLFDFELEHPGVWSTCNMWFVKPVNFRVKVRKV